MPILKKKHTDTDTDADADVNDGRGIGRDGKDAAGCGGEGGDGGYVLDARTDEQTNSWTKIIKYLPA